MWQRAEAGVFGFGSSATCARFLLGYGLRCATRCWGAGGFLLFKRVDVCAGGV